MKLSSKDIVVWEGNMPFGIYYTIELDPKWQV